MVLLNKPCLLEPLIPEEAQSPNIERIYGTKTSAFELFVLKRKIMGPCWLNIQSPKISSRGVSFSSFTSSPWGARLIIRIFVIGVLVQA